MIRSLAGEFSVKTLCRVLGVSRSGYYPAQRKVERPRSAQRALGSEDRNELRGEPAHRRQSPARHRQPSSLSHRPQPPGRAGGAPRAARPPPAARPGQVWQADITDVATKEGWLYVAGALEACSRRIVGWAAEDTMPTALITRAFERALRTRQPVRQRRQPRAAAPLRCNPEHEPGGQLL